MLEYEAFWFAGMGLAAFIIAGTLAPLETLSWWAGEKHAHQVITPPDRYVEADVQFVVYLGGIDTIEGESHSEREIQFLNQLRRSIAPDVLVTGVFPYAASGEPLLQGPRALRWLWRRLALAPEARRHMLANLINLRNLFQVLVSADQRYGPIFNAAIADIIVNALTQAGWRGHDFSVIGYSGGAQMAVAAAPFLRERLSVAPHVVSLGGTVLSAGGLDVVARLDHIVSPADPAPKVTALVSPSHWFFTPLSPWRSAVREGRLRLIVLGPMKHSGPAGYLGNLATADAASPNWRVTLAAVANCLRDSSSRGLARGL